MTGSCWKLENSARLGGENEEQGQAKMKQAENRQKRQVEKLEGRKRREGGKQEKVWRTTTRNIEAFVDLSLVLHHCAYSGNESNKMEHFPSALSEAAWQQHGARMNFFRREPWDA